MKSFNETGPNCSGKLPYLCVLNGSDPSATRRVPVSHFSSRRLPVFLTQPPATLLLLTSLLSSSSKLDHWDGVSLNCPHFVALITADALGEWLPSPAHVTCAFILPQPGNQHAHVGECLAGINYTCRLLPH